MGCRYHNPFQLCAWPDPGAGLGRVEASASPPPRWHRQKLPRENADPLPWPPPRMPAPRKDPPWITLVQTEPKKKPAPLPPGSSPGPLSQACRQVENGGLEERTQNSPGAEPEPKPYNPFEEEEEEESAPAVPSPAPAPPEATPKSLHPWYGITPTSSPKTKKRPAPRAPSASPLGKCRELPYLCVHCGVYASC